MFILGRNCPLYGLIAIALGVASARGFSLEFPSFTGTAGLADTRWNGPCFTLGEELW